MTTSPLPAAPSHSPSNGASPASLPRWRQFLSDSCHTARHLGATLNWRRDPGFEQRMLHYEQNDEQRMLQHEQRMKRLKSEIEQIEKETEQL